MTDTNQLYYGDNLDILRRYIDDESVDLVYLDPPFKSDENYNVLFEGDLFTGTSTLRARASRTKGTYTPGMRFKG